MNKTTPEALEENRLHRQAIAEAKALLAAAGKQLHGITQDTTIMAETPVETEAVIASVAEAISAALRRLESIAQKKARSSAVPGGRLASKGNSWPSSANT